ncbi:MAG TPA: hypothetical protein VFQ53_43145 [Kofleriaceae bacterium]|nr:hypothetical protein [Kofleriaceae bacterium]
MKAAWVLTCTVAWLGVAHADEPAIPPTSEPAPDVPATAPRPDRPTLRSAPREIVVDIPGERSRNNKLVLIGVTAASAIAGGIGLYYHLDSRSASDEVSAQLFTGRPWTADDEATVDRAASSRTRAAIGYSIGGALLVGAIVGYTLTDPAPRREVIRTSLVPVPGGAIAGAGWRF